MRPALFDTVKICCQQTAGGARVRDRESFEEIMAELYDALHVSTVEALMLGEEILERAAALHEPAEAVAWRALAWANGGLPREDVLRMMTI